MKKKSFATNALLSGGQKLLSIIFPLITFPYISRVLDVEDIGKINFSNSIVSYFLLIAGLGINNYATREGAKIRDDKEKLQKFSNEMFSINIFSTMFAYLLLLICMICFPKLHAYSILIFIQSFTIIGTTVGVNWIYSIEEDYLYITIRTLLMQLASLMLMFLVVHNQDHYLRYAIITVVSAVGANVFNYFHSRKYIKIKLTKKMNIKKHIKPILIIFSSAVAVTIYVNSDMTLLGWICSEKSVGLYSRSVRIYTIVKQMIGSMIIVALPKLSHDLGADEPRKYVDSASQIYKTILMIAIPTGIGLAFTADDIMLLIAGNKYQDAIVSLSILGFSCIFAIMSSFVTYCVLLPLRYEKVQMVATYTSATLNIVINLFILENFQQNGAAVTTLISEFVVFVIEYMYINFKSDYKDVFKLDIKDTAVLFIANGIMVAVIFGIKSFNLIVPIEFILVVLFSIMEYFLVLFVFKFSGLAMLVEVIKKR